MFVSCSWCSYCSCACSSCYPSCSCFGVRLVLRRGVLRVRVLLLLIASVFVLLLVMVVVILRLAIILGIRLPPGLLLVRVLRRVMLLVRLRGLLLVRVLQIQSLIF